MRPGDSGYTDIAFFECRRYIALLRRAIGPEPKGAQLRFRRSQEDIDPYVDVTVDYDDENPVARLRDSGVRGQSSRARPDLIS